MRINTSIIFVIFISFILTSDAKAYLDPGSGGMLLQLVLAGIGGLLAVIRFQWSRIKLWFSQQKNKY